MDCGKSARLIEEAYNYNKYDKKIIVAKPSIDKKGDNKIVSRTGLERVVDILLKDDNLKDLYDLIDDDINAILIDEAQFLTKNQVMELFTITRRLDIPVIAYGLKSNFKAELFEGSAALIALADSIEELPTICSCGKKARFNARKVNGQFVSDGDVVAIDGFDNVTYESLCGSCYLEKVMNIDAKVKKLYKR